MTEIHVEAGQPRGLFVLIDGSILVSSAGSDKIEKLIPSTGTSTFIAPVPPTCFDLFVDVNNTIYCSIEDKYVVITVVLDINGNSVHEIAGIGGEGPNANMLSKPRGIFVDLTFRLYVADCGNDRVQLFQYGKTEAETVVGHDAPGTIDVKCPSDIAMDANGYLFIVDSYNHRIIGSGAYGFRCVIGCFGSGGSDAEHLSHPQSMAFDSYGNIYVVDTGNDRVQQFFLQTTACGKFIAFCPINLNIK